MNVISTSPQAEEANGLEHRHIEPRTKGPWVDQLGIHEWGEGVGTGPCLGMGVFRTTFLELF